MRLKIYCLRFLSTANIAIFRYTLELTFVKFLSLGSFGKSVTKCKHQQFRILERVATERWPRFDEHQLDL